MWQAAVRLAARRAFLPSFIIARHLNQLSLDVFLSSCHPKASFFFFFLVFHTQLASCHPAYLAKKIKEFKREENTFCFLVFLLSIAATNSFICDESALLLLQLEKKLLSIGTTSMG